MTNAETVLAAAIKAKTVREIPGLELRMAKHQREIDDVESKPWLPKEKRRVILEKEAALRADVAALVEQARARALQEFDRREGAIRAQARASGANASDTAIRAQVFRGERARQLSSLADRATSPAAARAIYQEALLSDDRETIRLVGEAVAARMTALATSDKGKALSALRDHAVRFSMEHADWQKKNPSVVEELREIEHARFTTALLFDESARFALRLYNVSLPAAAPELKPVPNVEPSDSSIKVGPAFDRMMAAKE